MYDYVVEEIFKFIFSVFYFESKFIKLYKLSDWKINCYIIIWNRIKEISWILGLSVKLEKILNNFFIWKLMFISFPVLLKFEI
jgi:hypothetical protein